MKLRLICLLVLLLLGLCSVCFARGCSLASQSSILTNSQSPAAVAGGYSSDAAYSDKTMKIIIVKPKNVEAIKRLLEKIKKKRKQTHSARRPVINAVPSAVKTPAVQAAAGASAAVEPPVVPVCPKKAAPSVNRAGRRR